MPTTNCLKCNEIITGNNETQLNGRLDAHLTTNKKGCKVMKARRKLNLNGR